MARLPQPGGDSGQWGQILNEFLSQAHNSDGSLKNDGVVASKYVKPVGGIPKSDLSTAVQASLDNADAAASGTAPDATASTKGVLRLSGDLSGTALTPLIAAGAVTGGGGGSIATGTITDANIHATANIAKSKLAPLALTDSDIASGAGIAQSKVSGLTTSLSGKANASHTHPISEVTGLQSELDSKAATSHTHAQADITGLASALSGKANTTHTHDTDDISGLDQYVSDAIGNKIVAGSNISVAYDADTGETTLSATATGSGGGGSTTVDTVAGRTGDVVLVAGDITSGTFSTARIPNLDTAKITTGTFDITRLPTGTSGSTVALGNHTHDTAYAGLTHTHAAADVTSGTLNIARIPTGTSASTVALGNHTHDTLYAPLVHDHDSRYYTESEVDNSLALKLDANQKGVANGVATLGSDSKIPISQLPALAINDTFTAANQSAMLALTAQRGDVCIRTDVGKTFILSTDNPATLADWKEITASGQVSSVNGQTGTVTLTAAQVGAAATTHTHAISDVTNLSSSLAAKLDTTELSGTWGVLPTIKWTGTTWPARTTPAGYSGAVIWDSATDISATAPSASIAGDRWMRRVA